MKKSASFFPIVVTLMLNIVYFFHTNKSCTPLPLFRISLHSFNADLSRCHAFSIQSMSAVKKAGGAHRYPLHSPSPSFLLSSLGLHLLLLSPLYSRGSPPPPPGWVKREEGKTWLNRHFMHRPIIELHLLPLNRTNCLCILYNRDTLRLIDQS